jgi:hypothetical protein
MILIEKLETARQDLVQCEMYMKVPKGFHVKVDADDYVLKLHKNLNGQVWNKHFVQKLVDECHFVQSKVDKCVFYGGQSIYVLYTELRTAVLSLGLIRKNSTTSFPTWI